MSKKKLLALDELEQEIEVPNPGERICRISSGQSGWKDEQVFTSAVFPDRIVGMLQKELTKKLGHPAFCLEASRKKLILQGWYGYNYGPRLMNMICDELLSFGEVYSSRSITKSDFECFNHKEDGMKYWLSSRCEREHGLYRVSNGEAGAFTLFDPDGYEEYYADNVRPFLVVMNIDVETFA